MTYNDRTISVSMEQLESHWFLIISKMVFRRVLSCIIIDETHYAFSSKHHWACLLPTPPPSPLRQFYLPTVLCTATLPPVIIPWFLKHFQILSSASKIICGGTPKKEILFNAFTIVDGQFAITSLLHFQDAEKQEKNYLTWLGHCLSSRR
jgi:hypothetical protein